MIQSRNDPFYLLSATSMPTKENKPSKLKAKDALNACIICFEILELNKNQVKVKFREGDKKSVKEYIKVYHKGHDKYNLTCLCLRFWILVTRMAVEKKW